MNALFDSLKEHYHFFISNTSIFITVEEKVEIVRKLQDVKVTKVSGKVVLECEFSKPGLAIEWLKDDRTLKSSNKYKIETDGKTSRLTIQDIDFDDDGEYVITAKNLKSTASVKVEGKFMERKFYN